MQIKRENSLLRAEQGAGHLFFIQLNTKNTLNKKKTQRIKMVQNENFAAEIQFRPVRRCNL